MSRPASDEPARAALRIESSRASDEEVAAVIAVVDALLASESARESTATAVDGWSRSVREMRPVLRPGPGAWRTWT